MPMIWPAHVLVGQILATNQSGSYFQGNFSWSYYAIFPHKGPRLSFIPQMSNEITKLIILCYIMLHSAESSVWRWSLFCLLPFFLIILCSYFKLKFVLFVAFYCAVNVSRSLTHCLTTCCRLHVLLNPHATFSWSCRSQ
jgi:hypothetical protein